MKNTKPELGGADPLQASFQKAFRRELYAILDSLPMPIAGEVIDVPCGDGFYTAHLAKRIVHVSRLTAVDSNEDLLRVVRGRTLGANVQVLQADAYELPFEDESFDFVWCAQSLISLDPAKAAAEMFRICRPDGVVAILEADQFHHILLPWPSTLEVALNAAIHAASVAKFGDGIKLAPARRLRRVLHEAGFQSVHRTTLPIERTAPFDAATRDFLDKHIAYLRTFAYPYLSVEMQRLFDERTGNDHPLSVVRSPHAELECMNVVYVARKRHSY